MKKFNQSYIGKRNDIVKLVPTKSKKILDIGCSIGTVGRQIKDVMDAHITGIELSEDMANEASQYIDEIIIGNVEAGVLDKLKDNIYDCIILADIIEHLVDPWKVINHSYRILKDGGVIIASIPNIRHVSTIFSLVFKGYWPYRERGIHDRTHLRFFTKKNIVELFENENFIKKKILANYRINEKPRKKINKLAKLFSFWPFKNFFVFQYIVVYKKINQF